MNQNNRTNKPDLTERLGKVGGQAVLEGVMMKAPEGGAIAVRRENGIIVSRKKDFKSIRDKYKVLNIPVVRGVVNFIEMMAMSMGTLTESADMLGLDEETDKKKKEAESAEEEKKGGSAWVKIASVIGSLLGIGLAFFLFFFLPTFLSKNVINKVVSLGWLISLTEGIVRLVIFIAYILLVSLMKDIRRTFEYHGAEHMSVFCYEAGEDLTVENARKYSRFHPRCGTSFLIVMMFIGVLISMLIPLSFGTMLRILTKLCVFPFIIGIGYEFIRFAGKHDNIFIRTVSQPGLWIQRLTTKKPDDRQLEVALKALKLALPAEYPEEEAFDLDRDEIKAESVEIPAEVIAEQESMNE